MTIETELRARLAADGAVAALVSTRIYPLVLPQNPTLPAVTFSRVSGLRLHDIAGAAGRGMPRISFSSWAETYTGAQTLAAAVRASLNGFIGVLATISAVVRLENEIDLYEDETFVYRILQDYIINHTEA